MVIKTLSYKSEQLQRNLKSKMNRRITKGNFSNSVVYKKKILANVQRTKKYNKYI